MKKLLALVLALVMVMGLSVVGANAATYSDADSITYKEAVDVMSAVGVLGGSDGKFDPTGSLTREQGAKILTYMLMGGNQKAADALNAGSAPFTDVAADRWSAGSIAYCKATGILGGNGDGTFSPEAPLTGAAFAKMLLTALGYDANREGLVGGDWQLNVARLVNATNLSDKLPGFSFSSTVTRQEAAQLALNTFKATMVEYTGGTLVTAGDVKVETSVPATNRANVNYDYRSTGAVCVLGAAPFAVGGTMQFVENYFPNLKYVDGATNVVTNNYGETINRWFLANNRLDYVRTKANTVATDAAGGALATYTTNVGDITLGDLYTLTGNNTALPVYENGTDTLTTLAPVKGSTTKAFNDAGTKYYKGATVEVFDNNADGTADRIIVKYPYLAKVTKVTEATASKDRNVTLTVYNTAAGTTGVTFETEKFAKDDYVLVYPKGTITATGAVAATALSTNGANEIIEAVAATNIHGTVGTVTGNNGASVTALTLDGTKYTVGAAAFATMGNAAATTVAASNYGLGDGYTLYLANGYIVGASGDSAAYKEYVYVVNSSSTSDGFVTYNNVYYVTQDGVTHTAKAIAAPTAGWNTIGEDGSNAGYNTFTHHGADNLALAVGTDKTLANDKPVVSTEGGNFVANSNTIFLIRTGTTSFTTITGIANVGTWTRTSADDNTSIVTNATGGDNLAGTAKLVYVDMRNGSGDSSSDTPIFLLKLSGSTKVGTKTYYTYDALVNGAPGSVTGTVNTLLSTAPLGGLGANGTGTAAYGALVTAKRNSDDYITSVTLTDAVSDTTATGKYLGIDASTPVNVSHSDGTLTIGGNSYTLASDASVYFWKATPEEFKTDIGDLVTSSFTGIIFLQFASSSDTTVKAVYACGNIA